MNTEYGGCLIQQNNDRAFSLKMAKFIAAYKKGDKKRSFRVMIYEDLAWDKQFKCT